MKYSEIKDKIKFYINKYGEKYSRKNWLFEILIVLILKCLFALYLIIPILCYGIILYTPFVILWYLSDYLLQVKDYIHEQYIAEIIIAIQIVVFMYYILFKFVIKPIAKWLDR